MPAGRKPTWDYAAIAEEFNTYLRTPFRPPRNPASAEGDRGDITRNRALFDRLASREPPYVAYLYLREISAGRMTEERFFSTRPPVPSVPWLQDFQPTINYEARLPMWFIRMARAWFRRRERRLKQPPDPYKPVGLDAPESTSLSLYIMADCLLDERFQWAASRVKQTWRMEEFTDPLNWYQWLHEQQTKAIERLSPREELRPELQRQTWINGLRWKLSEPCDDRSPLGLKDFQYDLPIPDYKRHLRHLALLAGGNPEDALWEDWVEALLWEARERPGVIGWAPEEVESTWLRSSFLGPVVHFDERSLRAAPPVEPRITGHEGHGAMVGQPVIEVPSRWVSLKAFPAGLRQSLLHAIIRRWGGYRELLSHGQRYTYLRKLVFSSQRRPGRQTVINQLWDGEGQDLEALPESEQRRRQTEAVRKASSKRRARSRRARERLQ